MTETATQARPTGRLAQLLDAMTADGAPWTTNKTYRFYRARVRSMAGMPPGQIRAVARGDLRDLTAWGWLTANGETGHHEYALNTTEDHA